MNIKMHYLKASFLVCALILLTAAGSKEVIIKALDLQMVKERIDLQTPLDALDETSLAPYQVLNKSKIDGATLESLGTEEYLQWFLEDEDAAPTSPTRYCSLFITYYTGTPDMVPHVPDECYVGGGNEFKSKQTLSLNLPGEKKIDFQSIRFTKTSQNTMQGNSEFTVQYFFHANGKYCSGRTETRNLLGQNWFSKYSYFCKVEWKFFGRDSFGDTYPDKEQTLAASEKLLAVLLSELEANHWPDWEAANAKQEE
ncbi:MAG: hypothetical protein ACYSUT_01280 [Planctomycetota bacterium]|jgi:hypothetical protein